MKKSWPLSARAVRDGLIGWLIATNVLVALAQFSGDWVSKALLFLCLAFLPGVVVLRALRIVPGTFSVGVVYSFGLSLLVLMVSGLVANQLWPFFGVERPLGLLGALAAWDAVTLGLITLSNRLNRRGVRLPSITLRGLSGSVWLMAGLSLLLPLGATLGAIQVNNGGGSIAAELTLVYAAALIVAVFLLRRRLPDELLLWFVFILGLTILLMTSLRGWDIVGHDIQREFRVFTLTQLQGRWDISLYRDPYNACLSITILPAMLATLMQVSGLVVFKLLLQIVFAACPVVIFVLLRRYVSKLGALTGTMLFLSYPTFITDSAMLTRQGVAYLFFALALLVISITTQSKRCKLMFFLCALGVVLSHYSTAYMFVGLFAVGVACKFGLGWWQRWRERHGTSSLPRPRTVLSPFFALLLFLMTFGWYAQITATSQGLATTLIQSITNIPSVFSDDNKSSDTATALVFASGKTQADLYQMYLSRHQSEEVATVIPEQYLPMLVSDELPFTKLGEKAYAAGLDPALIITLRQNFAKFLQLLAVFGVLYVTYRWLRSKKNVLEPDFICLSLAGLFMLVAMVMLPVLSVNYGILRAFQQTLIFLTLPMTILLTVLARWLPSRLRIALATSGIALLFLLFTGLFAQLLGGSSSALTMNNRGLYYGLYYSSAADSQSFEWLKQHAPKKSNVQAANFNRALMRDPAYPFTMSSLVPAQAAPEHYVYLDHAQVRSQKLYIYFESNPLIMTFPLDYYDNTKDQVYSTGSTRVYR